MTFLFRLCLIQTPLSYSLSDLRLRVNVKPLPDEARNLPDRRHLVANQLELQELQV